MESRLELMYEYSLILSFLYEVVFMRLEIEKIVIVLDNEIG